MALGVSLRPSKITRSGASRTLETEYVTTAENWGPREAGAALVRVAPLLCNSTRWTYHADPEPSDTFRIEVQNAAEFSGLRRFIAQGCIQYLGERVNRRPVRVTCTRPTPDQINPHRCPAATPVTQDGA